MSKRRRIIEGRWRCESCGTADILGRHKVCPNCGNPRDATGNETNFDFGQKQDGAPSTAATVTDNEGLDLAAAGADWFCPYCESANRGDGKICIQCGADRTKYSDESIPPEIEEPRKPSKKSLVFLLLGGFLFFVCAGCCGLGYWGVQTEPVTGQVHKIAWSHTIEIEQFQPAVKEGWRDELVERPSSPPVEGKGEVSGVQNIRDCSQKIHSHRSIPDGQEEVCEDVASEYQCGVEENCTVNDLGNGFAEEVCDQVPQYCTEYERVCSMQTRYRQEPVFKNWCRYDTMVWVPLAARTLEGQDGNPLWPDVSDLNRIRESRLSVYSVHFTVQFEGEDHEWEYNPETENEYMEWEIGRSAELEINNFGNIGFLGTL